MTLLERARILDMLDCLIALQKYTASLTRADLNIEGVVRDGIVYRIEIVGEAAKYVSTETREAAPYFPWRAGIRMRDRMAHGYRDINLDKVWKLRTKRLLCTSPCCKSY